ncbi:MAG: OPT/YSL family transporter [Terracidiphilus sp.]|nr:OPT/YSL family transporter [Terracidiphilus sp.]
MCAQLLSNGLHSLPPGVLGPCIAGLVYGTCAAVARKCLPPRFAAWVPSSVALALGVLIGPAIPFAFLLGSLLFGALSKRGGGQWVVPVASGMIAGEGLAGIVQGVAGVCGSTAGALSLVGCYGFPC